jgi:hypothetical protein
MARAIESWFICNGRYRIHSVRAAGHHPEGSSKSRTSIAVSAFMGLALISSDWRFR